MGGCGCSTLPRQAVNTPEQDKVTPETFGNQLAPERAQMEDDSSSTRLIDGEYTKVNADNYSRASTPEAPEQAGVGTWGTGDRFDIRDNGVPGAKYNLPEDTGTDPCGAVFGKMTADRFPVSDNGVPGPKYDLPEEHDACNAVFGKMTGDRFVDLDNMVPGPGAYEAPKRFFDPKLAEPCFAVFGKDNAERMHVVEDVTKDTFAKYDVNHNVQSTALKVPTSSFGKKTSGRFTKPKKKLGPIYNVAAPKWGAGKGAAGNFGTATSSRFRVRRNSLGGPGGYNPGSTFGAKSTFAAR